jgi:peptidoglycan/xylan/chitin deacetylase (PgdA/CDA1 family)
MKMNNLYYNLSKLFNIAKFNISQNGRRILMFHSIEESVQEDPKGIWTIKKEKFEEFIQFIIRQKIYHFRNIKDPINPNEKSIVITFDDGYKNNYTIASKILNQYSIPYCIFISCKFLQDNHPDFLTKNDLLELYQDPLATLGNHGWTHQDLTQLSPQEIQENLKKSHYFLSELIGSSCQYFSYPHGGYSSIISKELANLGYLNAYSSFTGINHLNTTPLCQKRFSITNFDTLKTLDLKLKGAYDWLLIKQKLIRQ